MQAGECWVAVLKGGGSGTAVDGWVSSRHYLSLETGVEIIADDR